MKRKISILFVLIFAIILFPQTIHAATSLDSVLKDGKLVIPSVTFENSNIAMDTIYSYFYDTLQKDDLGVSNCNTNYTHCTLSNGEDSREVDVVWEYDPNIKKIVEAIAAKYPQDKTVYIVEDFEILNKHINGGNIISNSLEFKKNIQYKNFYIDQRGGGGPELTDSAIGMLKFKVDGTLYWKGERDPQFISRDIVYVKEDVDDVAAALQARIEKLFPDHTFEVSVTDDTIQRIITDYINDATERYNQYHDQFVNDGYATLEDFLAIQNDYDFLEGAEEYLYDIAVDDAFGFQVAVKKDSSKAVEKIDFITNDVLTNVTIKLIGTASQLPVDTKIEVEKITSGEDYQKLIKLLNVTNSETYDLKLYSKSQNRYISELEDGKFEVRIPISDSLKDKTLTVYYVDGDNNIKEYTVDINKEEGYASFITDHFSVYTIAAPNEEKETNPNTGDLIKNNIIILLSSLIGLSTISLYMKKRFN